MRGTCCEVGSSSANRVSAMKLFPKEMKPFVETLKKAMSYFQIKIELT